MERKDMTGVLFKARGKKSEKHPDYTGGVRIGGIEYQLSGWIRTPREGGERFIGLALREREERDDRRTDEGSDVPF